MLANLLSSVAERLLQRKMLAIEALSIDGVRTVTLQSKDGEEAAVRAAVETPEIQMRRVWTSSLDTSCSSYVAVV